MSKKDIYVVIKNKTILGLKNKKIKKGDSFEACDISKGALERLLESGDIKSQSDAEKAEKAAKVAAEKAKDFEQKYKDLLKENEALKKELGKAKDQIKKLESK